MVQPGIYSILNMSPYHMKPETRKKIEGVINGAAYGLYHLHVYPTEPGEFILKFDDEDIEHKDTPEDLKIILNHAKDKDIHMIYFDKKASNPHVNGLPIYLP